MTVDGVEARRKQGRKGGGKRRDGGKDGVGRGEERWGGEGGGRKGLS